MNERSIITIPDHRLSEVTQKVISFDDDLKNQARLMRKFLCQNEGVGLAANQLGFKNQICIVEFNDEENPRNNIPFQAFINPKIVQKSVEQETMEEGCLSVPQIELPTERSTKIKVRAQNLEGKTFKIAATDLLARILQHEIDHLNGILYTEHVKKQFLRDFAEAKKIKIIFFGSGDFAATILLGLILLGLNLEIITEKSKPAGRRQELKPSPVAELAKKFNQKFFELKDFSKFPATISKTDLLLCADFGQKIPEDILKKPKIAVNIHPSLLPKYRGATPIQNAILNNEKVTGISLIKMAAKIDQGPILAQAKMKIEPNDTALDLEKYLATLAVKILYNVLPKIIHDDLKETTQNEEEASLTKRFKKTDGEIDWQRSAEEIERQIRAFYPWPGSYTFINNKRIIIQQAHLEDEKLVLDKVQLEGKKPVFFQDFLHGYRGVKPKWFSKLKIAFSNDKLTN